MRRSVCHPGGVFIRGILWTRWIAIPLLFLGHEFVVCRACLVILFENCLRFWFLFSLLSNLWKIACQRSKPSWPCRVLPSGRVASDSSRSFPSFRHNGDESKVFAFTDRNGNGNNPASAFRCSSLPQFPGSPGASRTSTPTNACQK